MIKLKVKIILTKQMCTTNPTILKDHLLSKNFFSFQNREKVAIFLKCVYFGDIFEERFFSTKP